MGFTVWFNIGLGNIKCGNICIDYITDTILVININDKMLYVLLLPNIQTEPYLVFFQAFILFFLLGKLHLYTDNIIEDWFNVYY